MSSTIKVDNIQKVSDASNIIKKCSATTTIGSGSGNTVVVCGSTVTIGRCGGTVALASGASQTGFGREGSVDWQTSIKTTSFTAVSGEGYFVNTTSGAVTVTLPSSPSAGAIVAIKDYANTADTNAITIGRNGSNIDGGTEDPTITNEGGAATLVYGDATKGWQIVEAAQKSDLTFSKFVTATGGNSTTTIGDFKVHAFTGPGTFCVSSAGNTAGSNTVCVMVVGGGGGGGNDDGGGGGAGGMVLATSQSITTGAKPIAIGASGDTVSLASGASQTGFGRTGTVNWQTTVKTSNFTAANGEGYFVDTNGGAITVTLPAGTAGDIIAIKDYRNTFDTNAVTVTPNGSDKIGGNTNAILSTEGVAVTLVFIDSTRGWMVTDSGLQSDAPGAEFVEAAGGNSITTIGDFKVHAFTGPGTFTVNNAGNAGGSNTVCVMVVAYDDRDWET